MLATNIRKYRKQKGYSQEQIARKLHVSQGAVSQWENGVTTPISDQLASLSDIFGVTVDELLGRMTEEEAISLEARNRLQMDEKRIIDLYRRLNPQGKSRAFEYLLLLQHTYLESENAPY